MASTKVQTSESVREQRWRRRVLARKLCVTQLFLQSNLLLNWHTKPPWLMYGALKTLWELSWVYHLSYRVSNQHVFKLLEVMLSVMTPCFRRASILRPEKIGVEPRSRVFFTQVLLRWPEYFLHNYSYFDLSTECEYFCHFCPTIVLMPQINNLVLDFWDRLSFSLYLCLSFVVLSFVVNFFPVWPLFHLTVHIVCALICLAFP